MYKGLPGKHIITTPTGAELIKYASNAFLATKISFMNEMARICDAYGVNVADVAEGIGTDPRIGSQFLRAGLGYGGSCFPKDVSSLHYSAVSKQVDVPLLEATMRVNETQVDIYVEKLLEKIRGKLISEKARIAVWGLTFKPNTDDTRLSPALAIIDKLSRKGFKNIHAFDPMVTSSEENVVNCTDMYEAVEGADILIVATEWDEFKAVDWKRVKSLMNGELVLDGRNLYEPDQLIKEGLRYVGVGRSN